MFDLDHVAIQTSDIPGSVAFYKNHFGAEVIYEDQSWAFLRLGKGKLALVNPQQHPPHVAIRVDIAQLEAMAADCGQEVKAHRDGTRGIYLTDPAGNTVELINYPPDHKV